MSDPPRQNFKIQLFAWGANSCGQLSIDNTDDKLLPVKCNVTNLRDSKQICKVTGGGSHTTVIDDSGNLYSCGNNDKGQLGLGHTTNVSVLMAVTLPFKVRNVACGWDFTLIISVDGELFASGSNSFGQLGNGTYGNFETTFKKVQEIQGRVHDVAAGLRHSMALVDGEVFVWGNGSKSQLGQGPDYLPKCQMVPKKVLLPVNIKSIGAGSHSCVATTDYDEVYCWGSNQYGQCGMIPRAEKRQDRLVDHAAAVRLPEKVTSVSCGWSHVIAKGVSGKYFGWGRCDYGQLSSIGISTDGYHHPISLNNLPSQLDASKAGAEHNLAHGKSSVYTWGWNEHGMCGTGTEENVFAVHRVDLFEGENILTVGCGAGTSFVVIQGSVKI